MQFFQLSIVLKPSDTAFVDTPSATTGFQIIQHKADIYDGRAGQKRNKMICTVFVGSNIYAAWPKKAASTVFNTPFNFGSLLTIAHCDCCLHKKSPRQAR